MNDDIFLKEEIKNDELLKLMHEMRSDRSQEKMLEVLRSAAQAAYAVPVDVNSDGRYSFHAVSDSKKRKFIVAYSDTSSLITTEIDENQKAVKSSFEDLMEVVLNDKLNLDGVVINPGASEVVFGKELLNSIKQQMAGDDTVGMCVADPKEYPPRMKEMIENYAKEEPSLNKVYVRLLVSQDKEELRWLLVADTSLEGEQRQYMLDTFKRFMKPYLDGIDLIVASKDEEYVSEAIKDVKPFYERT